MRRWDLVGGDPAPGDPDAYDELAGHLRRTSDNASNAHTRLSALKEAVDDSIWKGVAADAFREQIDKLPGDLKRLFESYGAAADAMAEYGQALRTLQTEATGLVEGAERARDDEDVHRQALNGAVTADPTTPTAPYDDAMEAARQRIREAKTGVDSIRERRQGAETKAIAGLDHAGDVGIHNKKWYHKVLSELADAAEWVAFALSVVAVVVVVVVLLTNPIGWAALSAALAAAAPLFTWATAASAFAVLFKGVNLWLGDQDVDGGELAKDAAWVAFSYGFGRALGTVDVPGLRVTTTQFTQRVTELRPLLRVVTAMDDLLLVEARTVVNVIRVTRIRPVAIPINVGAIWDYTASNAYDIPKYLSDNPAVDRHLAGRPAAPALGVALGGDVSCQAVHVATPRGGGSP
ncbi:MAG: WXG100 family type VII secretion target [Acidimicrobiia bacterium]